jgi:hypothetical protein
MKHFTNLMGALAFVLFATASLQAQTLPAPFDLSSGNYSFTYMDTLPAGTYPPNMVLHTAVSNAQGDTVKWSGDFTCRYTLTGRSRINAEFANGISFINTGQSQNAACPGSTTVPNRRHSGDATVAINTVGRSLVVVNWTGRMLSGFNYVDTGTTNTQQTRFHKIQLQYSLDTANGFVNVPGASSFECNNSANSYRPLGDSASVTSLLPVDCFNQPVVYLRWVYCTANVGNGQRARLALDNILITSSDLLTGIGVASSSSSFIAYPNPNDGQWIHFTETLSLVRLYAADGRLVNEARNTRGLSLNGLSTGMYMLVNQKGETSKFVIR